MPAISPLPPLHTHVPLFILNDIMLYVLAHMLYTLLKYYTIIFTQTYSFCAYKLMQNQINDTHTFRQYQYSCT